MADHRDYASAIEEADELFEAALAKRPSSSAGGPPAGTAPPLQPPGGGGNFEGMDPWQQSVEGRLEGLGKKIDHNLLFILGAFAAGFVLLATLIVNRTDAVNTRLADLGERTARIEAKLPAAAAARGPGT